MKDRIKIAYAHFKIEPEYKAYFEGLGYDYDLVGIDCNPNDYDFLFLPGGGDPDPIRFNQDNLGSRNIDVKLDELQFGIIDKFVKAGKPIFGVCRGLQLINIYFGGSLIQDLPNDMVHGDYSDTDVYLIHECTAEKGSFLDDIYGSTHIVNSSHHQGLDDIGNGLRVIERSSDGLPEACMHDDLPILAVQWHPEMLSFCNKQEGCVDGSVIIKEFVKKFVI